MIKLMFITFILVNSSLYASNNESKQAVLWLEVDFPPAYIVKGENKGKGFSQAGLDHLIQKLSNHSHSRIVTNVNRLLVNMDNPKKVQCTPQLAVTVNQFPNKIYSNVAIFVPPSGIGIRKKDLAKFQKNGKVVFKDIIKNEKLRLGTISNGQFGDSIDPIIAKNKEKKHLYFRTGTTNQLSNYKMLLINRLDYVVDYPFSYNRALEQLSQKEREELVFLPVVEETRPKALRTICGDNPAAKLTLEKINKIYKSDQYKKIVVERLLQYIPTNLHDEYRKINLKSIGK